MEKERQFRIGRDQDCDIPIADDSVSRLHAQLTLLENGSYFLTDCHSTNGTLLIRQGRQQALGQELLSPGDRLRFGDAELSLEELLQVLRAEHSVPNPARTQEEPSPSQPTPSGRLIRCACGSVKHKGEPCPTCNT